MFQRIEDRDVYVVDLKNFPPPLPITGESTVLGMEHFYAQALTEAIEHRLITKPGKYGIQIDWSSPVSSMSYEIFEIIEDPS